MQKLGEVVRFEAKFYSVTGGALTGATVTCNLYNPSGTLIVSAGAATERANGRYSYDYTPDAVGVWVADFATTNVNADVLSVSDRQQIVAVTYFQTDVSALATQASITALGSPMQAGTAVTVAANNDKTGYALTSAYNAAMSAASQASVDALVAPDNATITAIDGKADDIIADIYALTHNEAGDPISRVVPPPSQADYCVVYEVITKTSTKLPPTSITAKAKVVALPYNYNGQLFTGESIIGSLVDNVVSWELPYGAVCEIYIQEANILSRVVVPAAARARVYDLL